MWSIWALDLNFKAPNQSCMPLVVKKNGNMWETFPTEGMGGHLFPTQLFSLGPELWFFGEDQKCSWGSKMKNKPNFFFLITGVSQTGGRGPLFPTQLFSLGPELWFFGEDQKCSWGSKIKKKHFFHIRGFPKHKSCRCAKFLCPSWFFNVEWVHLKTWLFNGPTYDKIGLWSLCFSKNDWVHFFGYILW